VWELDWQVEPGSGETKTRSTRRWRSCAKVSALLYALIGFVIGALLSVVSLVGAVAAEDAPGAAFGMASGIGAIIVLPLLYGTFGFLGTLLAAWLYNVAAGFVGGIEIDVR
jgi:hypothetical protein